MERKEELQEYCDRQELRLKKLALVMERWEQQANDASDQEADEYHQTVGRLKARLEATRHGLDEFRATGSLEKLRGDIDQAISDLEKAIARAAPRFQ